MNTRFRVSSLIVRITIPRSWLSQWRLSWVQIPRLSATGSSSRGQHTYDTLLRATLEPTQTGRFLALEPTSSRYFLADTSATALLAARSAMPGYRFYLVRVGHGTAH